MAKFNVLQHELVPEHHVVKKEDEDKVLKEIGIAKDLLPKISRSDPAIKALEEIHGPLSDGTIIRIVRKSPTMGYSVYYRVVASEVFK
ncbi:MAG TPA: DNA-directed RNA polymerase subunit H [Thermoplasmataceae archaeon]|nr:DNA-directed RNA polymerase subunit H [Thermoplasmatales archaeon AK]HLH85393.1 DNA-directed RNA polymerase subunit H [Thermoplasmataceae archaeon]